MDLVCPHCGCTLSAGKAAGAIVHGCASCGGIWLDNAASQKLVSAIDPAILSLADAASRMAAMPFPPHQARPLCPVCRGDLQGVRVEAASVALDTCNLHGTWFDRGELQSVARAFEAKRSVPLPGRQAVIHAPQYPPNLTPNDGESMVSTVASSVATGVAIDLGFGLLEAIFEAILSS